MCCGVVVELIGSCYMEGEGASQPWFWSHHGNGTGRTFGVLSMHLKEEQTRRKTICCPSCWQTKNTYLRQGDLLTSGSSRTSNHGLSRHGSGFCKQTILYVLLCSRPDEVSNNDVADAAVHGTKPETSRYPTACICKDFRLFVRLGRLVRPVQPNYDRSHPKSCRSIIA